MVSNAGIAELVVSGDPDVVLAAPNLGSCIGVAAWDPKTRFGGVIHCLLPSSASDPEKAKQRPYMYVDVGVLALLRRLLAQGANKRDLILTVAGGAQISDENNVFQIGKKNYTMLRKVLWKNNILIAAEDTGGNSSRTIALHVGSGETYVRVGSQFRRLR
ncbi:MAG TPA: chemotaxis protein CheD [Oligoflexia bacterium]|nr:chemotaxis protein CheD [Oligoflexia bacterium]